MADRTRLVALPIPPGPALVAALDRVARAGDAVLPLDPAAPAAVTAAQLEALRPDAVLDAEGREEGLPDPLPTPAGTAAVVATSGSTGTPKAVVLSAAAMAASWRGAAERLGARPGDRWLACLPTHHIAGLSVLWRSRLSGTDPVVLPGFELDAVAASLPDVAFVSLVPTQLRRLLAAGVPLSSLKAVLLGGARVDPALREEAEAAGVNVVATYGMSETCGGCVYDGAPLRGVEVRVDTAGRIRLRGPVLLTGYRGGPTGVTAALDAEGWFRTADLGRVGADGRLHVIGRADDVIITGGEKVLAGEVEGVLMGLPGVAEAAVVGRPDPEWGERVVATVVPAEGGRPPQLEEVRAAVRERLGAASAPKELVVVEALPRLATGKVDRLALREPR